MSELRDAWSKIKIGPKGIENSTELCLRGMADVPSYATSSYRPNPTPNSHRGMGYPRRRSPRSEPGRTTPASLLVYLATEIDGRKSPQR